ncbi:hypothetical protein HanXRQr2_Chr16g0749911 [Helianthus annuus]|uniref:Uncharacterized protein n=1 Tax=Helianthus annuus TaxID=4232 RepID=A0A9K3DTR5_HELAN|nr:hypothetical protein HanXRQr2_Chr16g0749911 [Helianthus annuus]
MRDWSCRRVVLLPGFSNGCIQACIVVVSQHVSCLYATLHISNDVLLRMGIMNPCFWIIWNWNIYTQVVKIKINNQFKTRN